jgi:hypothetical protein
MENQNECPGDSWQLYYKLGYKLKTGNEEGIT